MSVETNDSRPSSPEQESAGRRLPVGTGCLLGFFFVAWNIVTLVIDLMVVGAWIEKPSGESLFSLLLTLPFNTVLIGLWIGVVPRFVLSAKERLWIGTGFRLVDHGDEIRFRLPRISALSAAFVAAIVAPIVIMVCFGVATVGEPSMTVAVVALSLVAPCILVTYFDVARSIATGRADLVIDRLRGTLTLPQTFGRREPVTFGWADLVRVHVATEVEKDSDGDIIRHFVTVEWRDAGGASQVGRVAELAYVEEAEELAKMIREKALG